MAIISHDTQVTLLSAFKEQKATSIQIKTYRVNCQMALLLCLICCLFIISQIPSIEISGLFGGLTFSKIPFVTGAGLFVVIGFFSFIENLGKLASAHKRRVESETVLREANLQQ